MPKQATQVVLRKEERTALVQFTKQHRSAQQLVLRARIVLNAGEGHSNAETARLLSVSVETVRLWRDRWAALQGIDLKDRGVEEPTDCVYDFPTSWLSPTCDDEENAELWEKTKYRKAKQRSYWIRAPVFLRR